MVKLAGFIRGGNSCGGLYIQHESPGKDKEATCLGRNSKKIRLKPQQDNNESKETDEQQ